MKTSDSDSESECFESAEESLDETDDNVEIKSQKSLVNSEGEVAEPALWERQERTAQEKEEKHKASSSVSFRKRPERAKRLPDRTPNRSASKSPTKEPIFKPDKIVPGVFFQDITSNLSKNINKSLSTLQQKSSNVKDLIFSSIPSSGNESEGFSYDDKSAITPTDECETANIETDSQNVSQPVCELLEKETEKNNINKENIFAEETSITKANFSVGRLNEIVREGTPPGTLPNNSKDKFQEDHNLLDDADAKGDVNALVNKVNNFNSESVFKEKESFKDSSEKNTELIVKQEGISSEEISKTNTINTSLNSNEENRSFTKSKQKETNLEKSEDKKIFDSSGFVGDNDLAVGDKNSFNQPSKEVSEVKSECNLSELKVAARNTEEEVKISLDKDDSSNNNNNNNCEVLKDKLDPEENIYKVDESSKDGWDDFDFSDNEVEDITTSKSSNMLIDKEKNSNCEMKGNKCGTEIKGKITNNKVETRMLEESDVKQEYKNKDSTLEKHSSNKTQSKESMEPVSGDGWDNWDNWDEPEDKKEEMDFPEDHESKTKNIKENDSSDISKWSGWDTFGQKPQEKQGNWGLGSWGVDLLLNKATAVTQGISNVLEAGLGAPDPETLARMEKIEREKWKEEELEKNETENEDHLGEVLKKNSLPNVNIFPVAGLTSLVAGVTSKIVEHSKIQEIGSKVITGGLDTLETFGKKTMEVLQEGDPGLKNKRALLLGNNKPVLSQVLREAREKAERESKRAEEKELTKKCHFETLFDDFQGMIHLEALEMLSRQCELKLDQIRSGMNSEEQEDLNGTLEEVEQLCSLDECDMDLKPSVVDFKTALQMAIDPLKNEISIKRIVQIHDDVSKWLQMSETEPSFIVINQKLVATLAELTAAIVQQFHKSGELLSIKECRKTVEEVDALSRLTNVLCMEIKRIGEKFMTVSSVKTSGKINDVSIESFNAKATAVMENSTSYIRQAFDLLIPVIQLGAAV